jgi:hypothetical protein
MCLKFFATKFKNQPLEDAPQKLAREHPIFSPLINFDNPITDQK